MWLHIHSDMDTNKIICIAAYAQCRNDAIRPKWFCQAHVGLVSLYVQYSLKLFKLNVFDLQYFTEFCHVNRNSNSILKISKEF